MTHIRTADPDDFKDFLSLAHEVEPLFGPMVEVPAFREGLKLALSAGTVFCAAEDSRPLHGGIVIDPNANEIAWLAVSEQARGKGSGGRLLRRALDELAPRRPVRVVTFAGECPEGAAARKLYVRLGFTDIEPGPLNPAGIATAVMERPAE